MPTHKIHPTPPPPPKPVIPEYKILCSPNPEGLTSLVNNYMELGWKLHGNLLIAERHFYQTIVK